jgi:hypothetical protein
MLTRYRVILDPSNRTGLARRGSRRLVGITSGLVAMLVAGSVPRVAADATPGSPAAAPDSLGVSIDRDHVIDLQNGRFHLTNKSDLDHLFQGLSTGSPVDTLVVHFHGGLVSENEGLLRSEALKPKYELAGAYPVFFVWESSLHETIAQNEAAVSKLPLFQHLVLLVGSFIDQHIQREENVAMGRSLEEPGSRMPACGTRGASSAGSIADRSTVRSKEERRRDSVEQLRHALQTDDALATAVTRIAGQLRSAPRRHAKGKRPESALPIQEADLLGVREAVPIEAFPSAAAQTNDFFAPPSASESLEKKVDDYLKSHILGVFGRVLDRWEAHRWHGAYPTIIEEVLRASGLAQAGGTAWEYMKQATEAAFQDDPQQYGGAAFIEGLRALAAQGRLPRRILLVGHSAGAIYACHFLQHALPRLPADTKFEVVFLAPACRFELLAETLRLCGDRAAFRIFSMNDDREAHDVLVAPLYPRSLLYFISGVLEQGSDTPLVGMERYYKDPATYSSRLFPAVEAVRQYLQSQADRLVWSPVTAHVDGRDSGAITHSSFDDGDAATLESIRYIIQYGLIGASIARH